MHDINDLIRRYLGDTASDEEQRALREMIRSGRCNDDITDHIADDLRSEIAERRLIDLATQAKGDAIFSKILAAKTNAAAPEQRQRLLVTRPSGSAQGRRWASEMMRYAAVVLLLVAAAGAFYWQMFKDVATTVADAPDDLVQVVNRTGAVQQLALHDGSKVALAAGSELRYPGAFSTKREVYLSGEAFFEVAHDASRPFLVYTKEVTTTVLGTSFRVKAYDSEKQIVVAVKTGRVSVSAKSCDNPDKDPQKVVLTPNLQAVYDRKQQRVVKEIVEQPHIIAPQPVLKNYYTNVRVVDILKALSRSYGVDIRYDEAMLAGCTLTAEVMEEEGLYEQLEIVCHALGGTYQMEDAAVIIQTNGCKK